MDIKKALTESTDAVVRASEQRGIRHQHPVCTRFIQNFRLVWLDGNADEIKINNCANTIKALAEVMNSIHRFTDVNEFIDFINNIQEEKIFILFSGVIAQATIPMVRNVREIKAIFTLSEIQFEDEDWKKEWSKIKGLFTDVFLLCEALQKTALTCDRNFVHISIISTIGANQEKNFDELDQSFMYKKILKEIMLAIDFQQKHFNEFISYCRQVFQNAADQLETVSKLERESYGHAPIWLDMYQSRAQLRVSIPSFTRLNSIELEHSILELDRTRRF
ncbi:unnamed protein product, partial [Rotaria magnacalcarata]